MKSLSLLLVALLVIPMAVSPATSPPETYVSLESIPARWGIDLSSTFLSDYKPGEHLIIASVWTWELKENTALRTEKYSSKVKVSDWNKSFSSEYVSKDMKTRSVFKVILREMTQPQDMRIEYEHEIYEDGELFLKFAGSTILYREK